MVYGSTVCLICSGEPTIGKTRPETLLRQLTTKKGQVRFTNVSSFHGSLSVTVIALVDTTPNVILVLHIIWNCTTL